MNSNIKDIATYADISIATVSRAVSVPERVSAPTPARVQAAMDALHYRPNALGHQLRAERTGLLGVVLSSLTNPVFAECMQGIKEAASVTGRHAVFVTIAYDRKRKVRAIETVLEQRVDDLILAVGDTATNSHLNRLDAEHIPYVLVYNDTVGQARIPARCCMVVGNRAATRDAIHALLAQNHRQTYMLTGTPTAPDCTTSRHNGYRKAPEAAGVAPRPFVGIDFDAGAMLPAKLARLLALPRPTAIFCGNDRLMLLTVRSLRGIGLRVPEDVSVADFNGLAMGQRLSPTLATMAQPHRRIGTDAATALARHIANEVVSLITLPHRLLAGGTLARAPAEASLSVVSPLASDTQGASR